MLVCFSTGMSMIMKRNVNFVNIPGNAFNTITNILIDQEYEVNVANAAAA